MGLTNGPNLARVNIDSKTKFIVSDSKVLSKQLILAYKNKSEGKLPENIECLFGSHGSWDP
jgi:hypothetical protein